MPFDAVMNGGKNQERIIVLHTNDIANKWATITPFRIRVGYTAKTSTTKWLKKKTNEAASMRKKKQS